MNRPRSARHGRAQARPYTDMYEMGGPPLGGP